jgi:putative intracellular protease/amidase
MTHIKTIFVLLVCFFSNAVYAQNEQQQILSTLNNYIEGTSYNKKDVIAKAFYQDALLYLSGKDGSLNVVGIEEYISWYDDDKYGEPTGRIGEVLSIDIRGDVATAKAEILFPNREFRFIDVFLLKKLTSGWRIMSKSAQKIEHKATGKRILFIVSNASFHGDSTVKTGVSFSEIVNAYHVFKEAGYTVDFVSPEGGAIPLSYIDTSKNLHKQYLYNSDFMYAIGHTKSPTEIIAKHYRAVHYVGGGNAMYGVPENKALQKISMSIYEDFNGVISSVCHGTAGIVNLKTKDGKYLVAGKRVSGYPEAYESSKATHIKQFPFLIQQTIEQRKGLFKVSGRGKAHMEVDGRLVTGQNYLSSALVAEQIIEILEAD